MIIHNADRFRDLNPSAEKEILEQMVRTPFARRQSQASVEPERRRASEAVGSR